MKKINYIAVGVIVALMGACMALVFLTKSCQVSNQQLRLQAKEISVMAQDYQVMQERIVTIEHAAKNEHRGVSALIDEVLASLNIQNRLVSLKNMEQKTLLDLSRQDAELVINNLSMNEAINLLYVLEKGSYPISLRSVEMSHAFESPDVLNLRLVISCFQKK